MVQRVVSDEGRQRMNMSSCRYNPEKGEITLIAEKYQDRE